MAINKDLSDIINSLTTDDNFFNHLDKFISLKKKNIKDIKDQEVVKHTKFLKEEIKKYIKLFKTFL